MTKSSLSRRCNDAFLNRAAQALRILAVPEGGPVVTANAPGRLLCGHVVVGADIEAWPPATPLPTGEIDAVTAKLFPGRATACSISVLHAGSHHTDYRICVLPRSSGVAFFASRVSEGCTFKIINGRLIEHPKRVFASPAERLEAIARGEAAFARLVEGR